MKEGRIEGRKRGRGLGGEGMKGKREGIKCRKKRRKEGRKEGRKGRKKEKD